jgi:hypothetical protein
MKVYDTAHSRRAVRGVMPVAASQYMLGVGRDGWPGDAVVGRGNAVVDIAARHDNTSAATHRSQTTRACAGGVPGEVSEKRERVGGAVPGRS